MSGAYVPKTAMFIVAHPDDIEFGVAGTAAKWARAGSRVIYVIVTDGNVGSHEDGMTPEKLAAIRRAEQTAAGEVAGAECIFLGYHDGFVQPTLELRKALVRLIRQHRPDAVVCTDPSNYFPAENYINHPDHRAVGQATLDAVFPAAEMSLLYPDLLAEGLPGHKVENVFISFGERVNHYVDITDTIDLKIEALQKHVSQLGEWNPADMMREWAAETGKKVGFAYAEGFYRITLKPFDTPAEPQPEV